MYIMLQIFIITSNLPNLPLLVAFTIYNNTLNNKYLTLRNINFVLKLGNVQLESSRFFGNIFGPLC